MEQFVVPQFIDVESKILGPITTKQFVIMVVWGLFVFIAYKLLDTSGFVLFFLFWTTICGLLGFYKVNGRPFYIFLLILIQGKKKPITRVWRHIPSSEGPKKATEKGSDVQTKTPQAKVLNTRLSELALMVDTGGVYIGEGPLPQVKTIQEEPEPQQPPQ